MRKLFNSRWVGAVLALLLIPLAAAVEGSEIDKSAAFLGGALILSLGLIWAFSGSHKLRRLSEFYLWLAFILSLYYSLAIAEWISDLIAYPVIDTYRGVAILQIALGVAATLGIQGGWQESMKKMRRQPVRIAAVLFIGGAIIFWVGARTFQGMSLEIVKANITGHQWTAICFILASVITAAAFAILTSELRRAHESIFSVVGLVMFCLGTALWILHLAFRLTVQLEAARIFGQTGLAPEWYEPWRQWAGGLFAAYSGLAYLGMAAYGLALFKVDWLPGWVSWVFIAAGVVAIPLGGLPLFIHVPLWLAGILLLHPSRDTAVK